MKLGIIVISLNPAIYPATNPATILPDYPLYFH